MPLLTSPITGKPMQQIVRNGVEIDVCPDSGGIWLDKGELEKLLYLMKEEAANEQSHRFNDHQNFSGSEKVHKPREQESALSRIMDMFEF